MDDELEVIRDQMERTRSSLADKIETLEDRISGTVEEATEAVEHTVEAVKETFNMRKHIERHPWLMIGGAMTAGCLGAYFLLPSRETAENPAPTPPPSPPAASLDGHAALVPGPLQESMELIHGLAIGCVMGLVRELLMDALPASMTADAACVIDQLTDKMGGKPLGGSGEPDSCSSPREEGSLGTQMGGRSRSSYRNGLQPNGR